MKKLLFVAISVLALASITMTAFAGPTGSWITDFTLFNLDSANDANITIYRYTGFNPSSPSTDLGTVVTSSVISKNGSFYYNPASDATFPTGFSGSIMVSSDRQLAGTVTVANTSSGSGYASDAYSAVTAPATDVFLPIILSYTGSWNTRITIQNAGSTAVSVTVTYLGSGAPAASSVNNLPANMMAMVDQDGMATAFNGSARVTATGPVAVIVEEYVIGKGVLIDYNGIPMAKATKSIFIPGYLDSAPWATDFTVVNTTATAGTFTVTFSSKTETLVCTLAASGSVYLNRYNGVPTGCTGAFPTAYYGSATVNATVDSVLVYNIANSGTGGAGNQQMGYVGFAASDGGTNVVVPLIENQAGAGKWTTTYSVQVLDGSTANLTLTYSGVATPVNTSVTGSKTFNQGPSGDGHVPAGYIGGVSITSDKAIVIVADQNYLGTGDIAAGDVAAGFVGIKK